MYGVCVVVIVLQDQCGFDYDDCVDYGGYWYEVFEIVVQVVDVDVQYYYDEQEQYYYCVYVDQYQQDCEEFCFQQYLDCGGVEECQYKEKCRCYWVV